METKHTPMSIRAQLGRCENCGEDFEPSFTDGIHRCVNSHTARAAALDQCVEALEELRGAWVAAYKNQRPPFDHAYELARAALEAAKRARQV